MGLIQDLQGRKLTGCRGCDAIRTQLYKGFDLILPNGNVRSRSRILTLATTHDSSGASKLGAFLESALGARTDCLVSIDSISPSTFSDGDSVTITGKGFGASESNISLNADDDKSGTNVAQTVVSWSNTSISLTAVQGALTAGTVYLFVDCETVGNAVTLEEAGESWIWIQIGWGGFGDLGISIHQDGDTTGTLFNLVADNVDLVGYDNLPSFGSDTFNSSTTLTTSITGCSNISTPDGFTRVAYDVSSGSPDGDPGGPDVELRRDSDNLLLAEFLGLTACGDDAVPPAGHKYGYKP